ncbi:Transmembrane 4 L6 family member 19, partial [Ophiophagus hannah]
MCVGTCTRILGPCLLILGFLSITANILLLFPNWEWFFLLQFRSQVLDGGGSTSAAQELAMFLSILLSGLALLGSAACFILSGSGLTEGPLCLYNSTLNHNKVQQAQNYLYDPSLWNSVCIKPQNIVGWNVYFFSSLLVISTVEMILAALQIINGCFGCVCGLCEQKK